MLIASMLSFIVIVAAVMIFISSETKSVENIEGLDFPEIITAEMIMAAMDNEEKYKIPASITLGQIILESSGKYPGGLSLLAYECNNLFGMKGNGPAGSKVYKTKEEINGQTVVVEAHFRKYHDVAESIDEHGQLLSSPMYTKYTSSARNPEEFAAAIKKAGYATDSEYDTKLINIMTTYNLYRCNNGGFDIGDGITKGQFIFPTVYNAVLTSPFGKREAPTESGSTFHNGVDLAWNEGSPVYSADGGIVTYAGWYGGGGNTVIIDHGNGIETVYMHMPHNGIKISKGSKVSQGQLIGCIGNTGISTGPHLHFEIRIKGTPVDPLKYIKR